MSLTTQHDSNVAVLITFVFSPGSIQSELGTQRVIIRLGTILAARIKVTLKIGVSVAAAPVAGRRLSHHFTHTTISRKLSLHEIMQNHTKSF
jgi:hypothetical protein